MMRIYLLMLLVIITLSAEKLVLITNRDNSIKSLTRDDIKRIYLKKRRFWGEMKLTTLNLPPDSTLRQDFEKNILGMSAKELENYWMRQHYRGQRPPYRLKSSQSVLIFVKKVKGAIGYIPSSLADRSVRVVYQSQR